MGLDCFPKSPVSSLLTFTSPKSCPRVPPPADRDTPSQVSRMEDSGKAALLLKAPSTPAHTITLQGRPERCPQMAGGLWWGPGTSRI